MSDELSFNAVTSNPPSQHVHPVTDLVGITGTLDSYQKKIASHGEEIKELRGQLATANSRINWLCLTCLAFLVVFVVLFHQVGWV